MAGSRGDANPGPGTGRRAPVPSVPERHARSASAASRRVYRPGMRVAVLGPLEVLTDASVPVAVPGATERLLLAVLAAGAPGVVDRDRLLGSLSGDECLESAEESLRAHL